MFIVPALEEGETEIQTYPEHLWMKGSKPFYQRPECRPSTASWDRLHHNLAEDHTKLEDWVKKSAYGKTQIKWMTPYFYEIDPQMWTPEGKLVRRQNRSQKRNFPNDVRYVRRFLDPAKFKKLEIPGWEMPDNYPSRVTLQELAGVGMQYGHSSNLWHPLMLPYLYADYESTHIFDLVQTAACLNRACYYAMDAATKGAKFMFVGTKKAAKEATITAAKATGSPFYAKRWIGGTLTNYHGVEVSREIMGRMQQAKQQGSWDCYKPEEREAAEKQLRRMEEANYGTELLDGLPDIMIMVDEAKCRYAKHEADKMGIPTICLMDSNNEPKKIDLPVPGNTSSPASVSLFLTKLTEAIVRGQQLYAAAKPGERPEIKKEWDPYLFRKCRFWRYPRRSLRQPWHTMEWGSYEEWKDANPHGTMNPMGPFDPNFEGFSA